MAQGVSVLDLTFLANADLSGAIFKAVKKDTTGRGVVLCVDGDPVFGILQNKPTSGSAAIVRVEGESMAIVGANGMAEGDLLSADAAGCLDTATSGEYISAVCVQSGAAAALATVVLQRHGKK